MILYKKCDINIIHDTCKFEKFYHDFENNNLTNYNMNYKKYKKFYARASFKSNSAIDIVNIKNNFKNKFNFPIGLTNNQIFYEKHLAFGTINNLDIEKLCKKISYNELKVNVKSIDIFYDYKVKKDKIIKRDEKIIIITNDAMEERLKDSNVENYFIDVTYKIIPKRQKNYKLLTITGVDKITNNSFICALILIMYEDTLSFLKIFKYMKEFYGFKPKVVHIDYSRALTNALNSEELFNPKPIIIHCFFHFSQIIINKMKNLNIIKSRMNKYSFTLLKNIELICFMRISCLKTYQNFLREKLTDDKEKKLYEYLAKNWFNKEPSYYSYYELFDNENLNEVRPHFFSTNNIAEALHSKLSFYLPTKKITNTNFILSIRNIINNYETKKDKIIRKDYCTRVLIEYAKKVKYKKYVWLDYDTYKKMEISIIEDNNKNLNVNALDNLINSFNILNIDNSTINHENENNNISEDIPQDEEIEIESNNNSLNNSIDSGIESDNSSDKTREKYKISNLFERLLNDKKYLEFNDLILELMKNEKPKKIVKKRSSCDSDSDEELLSQVKNSINLKSKIKFDD